MHKEHEIVAAVTSAKKDREKADALLRDYLPFIRAQAAKQVGHPVSDQDDAQSIAMIAFHEAILGYDPGRGAFLPYAAMVIKSRIIDHQRREARHQGQLSLDAEQGDDSRPLLEEVADTRDRFAEAAGLAATQKEIAELAAVMAEFGVSFSDVGSSRPNRRAPLKPAQRRYATQLRMRACWRNCCARRNCRWRRLCAVLAWNAKRWSAIASMCWRCSSF